MNFLMVATPIALVRLQSREWPLTDHHRTRTVQTLHLFAGRHRRGVEIILGQNPSGSSILVEVKLRCAVPPRGEDLKV